MFVVASTEENQKIINEIISLGANDYTNSIYLKKGISNPIYRMISNEAYNNDLTYKNIKNTLSIIYKDDKSVATFSPNTPNLAFSTRKLLNNKRSTKELLKLNGISVPDGMVFIDENKALTYFNNKNTPQVIKPLTGSGGKGVTANIQASEEEKNNFKDAWDMARKISKKVIIEDFIEGDEVRVFVLDGKVEAAICRLPAHIIGNGINSIEELINDKNIKREKNPLLRLYPIKNYENYIEKLGLAKNYVPQKNKYIKLSSASNIAQGGDSVSIINVLHPTVIEMCQKIWHSIPGATQIGMDVIIKNFNAPYSVSNFSVIEVNADPAVATPVFSEYGLPANNLAKNLVKYVMDNFLSYDVNKNFKPVPVCFESTERENIPSNDYVQINLTRRAAFQSGLNVNVIDHVTTQVSNHEKKVLFWQGIPSTTLISTAQITTDKSWTKSVLNEIKDIKTPEGKYFNIDEIDEILKFYKLIKTSVVMKPVTGSGGFGVITNINTTEKLKRAINTLKLKGVSKVICEKYIDGKDYRLFITSSGYYAASNRIPANIIGDGVNSISELVKIKNIERKDNLYIGNKEILITDIMKDKLSDIDLNSESILPVGKYLQLDTVANIGTGGDSLDVTDFIHPDWLEIAESVRLKLFNATHIGIDIISKDISISPNLQNWVIIEVNSNPDYGLHHFPIYGKSRDVAGAVMDTVFKSSKNIKANGRLHLNCKIINLSSVKKIKNNSSIFGLNSVAIPEVDGSYTFIFEGLVNCIEQFKLNYLEKLKLRKVSIYSTEC